MRVIEHPEFYLAAWRESEELSPSKFLERQNKFIAWSLSDRDAQLRNLDRLRDPATLRAHLRETEFLSTEGSKALEEASPVLYRLLTYLSRYPFLPPPNQDESPSTLTPEGLLRAVYLASPEYADRLLLGGGNFTRPYTPADYYRLLFQGLATPRENARSALAPADEQLWRAKAEKRARQFGSPENQETYEDWARTNRTDDGDEIFNDLVDIMSLLQPDYGTEMSPYVKWDAFIPLAKEMVAKDGLCPDPLHCFALTRSDFSALVKLLLVMHLELEGGDPLPDNFDALSDSIVRRFFGEGCDEIDFNAFDDAIASNDTKFVCNN